VFVLRDRSWQVRIRPSREEPGSRVQTINAVVPKNILSRRGLLTQAHVVDVCSVAIAFVRGFVLVDFIAAEEGKVDQIAYPSRINVRYVVC